MSEHQKKPVIALVPAILTGSAALIAALTTTYINLRDDKKPATPERPVVVAPLSSAANTTTNAAAPTIARLQLQLDRIAVQHDGTMGTTDWRFVVEADGEPLFAFEQAGLNDEGGRNIAHPKDAAARLRVAPGRPAKIAIKGWRDGRFRMASGAPDVQGEGSLTANAAIAPIRAVAGRPEQGAFTFYFSANPDKD